MGVDNSILLIISHLQWALFTLYKCVGEGNFPLYPS